MRLILSHNFVPLLKCVWELLKLIPIYLHGADIYPHNIKKQNLLFCTDDHMLSRISALRATDYTSFSATVCCRFTASFNIYRVIIHQNKRVCYNVCLKENFLKFLSPMFICHIAAGNFFFHLMQLYRSLAFHL